MSRDGCVALPHGSMGLSAVCYCGISWSYSLAILVQNMKKNLSKNARSRAFIFGM